VDKQKIRYDYLMSFLGTPYMWGGANRLTGLDCSGFVIEYCQAFGALPSGFDSTAQGLYSRFVTQGAQVATSPQFGDLCFYGKDKSGISHIAIALDDTTMIEAGAGRSTTTSRLKAAEQGAMIRIRPIKNRTDLVAVLRVSI
jgi:cell wall-associated NlpC family hydrolase